MVPGTTRGFHGTTQEDADEIIRTNFKPSPRNTGAYLGEGVYFYENQRHYARSWARNHRANRVKGTQIAVIESEIRYGMLLNLAEPQHFETVMWFKSEFERKARTKATLAAVIDIIADQTRAEVVKGWRILRNPTLMDLGFSADIEVILAVREIKNILSKSIVLSEMIL